MNERDTMLSRIAAALDRIAPPALQPTDWLAAPAYIKSAHGDQALAEFRALPLETLRGVDAQKAAVVANLERLAAGHAAHDMLLWGARGMGKSAMLRSATFAAQTAHPGKLALVQVEQDALDRLPSLFDDLAQFARSFLIYIDDLGFGAGGARDALQLRSALDGGIIARPDNVRLAVTSNRRAIVTRKTAEQTGAIGEAAINESDARDDALALADRFGLSLGFHPCDRDTFLEIVRAYCDPLELSFNEEEALAWSIDRGVLSGRAAWQFATEIAGRAGKRL